MDTKEQLTYSVVIYRKDNNHIIVSETVEYKQAETLWEELQQKWQTAHKEAIPYILKEPEITAFEPGLIFEIKIEAQTMNTINNMNHDNPYVKRMMKQGFSNTFSSQGQNLVDLLDQGRSY